MKYVALLSGGKDSCFNLLHCQHNHHQLLAAATLSPQPGNDEIDSYMYQTVGQSAIALVAQALGVPLYRRLIQGDPIERAAEYGLKSAGGGGITGDETEDLYALLYNVLEHHPDIQAVSVGAILSNYQRVRVEHVCRRLSLTPLAYLWQRNQTALLSEMTSSGLNAVLIKVAGAGLTPSDLARPLSSMQSKLVSLHQRFGTHPCGEGGEYETFTTDSPLFNSRIDIKAKEVVVVDQSDVAPVAYLQITQASLISKETSLALNSSLDLPIPPLLEHPFDTLYRHLDASLDGVASDSPSAANSTYLHVPPELEPSVRHVGPWIAVGNVRLPTSHPRPLSIGEEVTCCFQLLQDLLAKNSPLQHTHSELLSTSAMITLLLPDLNASTFSSANIAYASFFGASPPARACIGDGGPNVGLDCLTWVGDPSGTMENKTTTRAIKGGTGTRRALHVQSLSYWAPANIGPYSQAISIPPYTFVSGQIGLIPSSLTLPSASVASSTPSQLLSLSSTLPLETALALQHTARVIRAAPNARLGDGSEGGFGRSDSSLESSVDDSTDNNRKGGWIQLAIYYLVDATDIDHVRRNVELVDGLTPTLYVVISSLPRGARIEKQVLVHSGRFVCIESFEEVDEGDGQVVDKSPEFTQGDVTVRSSEHLGPEILIHYEVSGFPPSSEACSVIFVRDFDTPTLQDVLVAQAVAHMKEIRDLSPFWKRSLAAKVFVKCQSSVGAKLVVPLLESMFEYEMPALTIVPSHAVTARAGSEWDWAVTLMAV